MARRKGQGPAADGAQPGEADNRPDFSLLPCIQLDLVCITLVVLRLQTA